MSRQKEEKSGSENKVPFTTRLADVFRAVAGKPTPHNFTSAVICAAGASTRMGGDTTKQFLELDGVPVIVRTRKRPASMRYWSWQRRTRSRFTRE